MLITGEKITKDKLLNNTNDDNISGGCYYLQIHSIIPAGEDAKSYNPDEPKKFHTLEPGGLAWIISEETFGIKDTSVTALVTLRSGFTKQGMLALDVGLVDANYSGPIGTLVINFSKNHIRLKAGDQFFRVMFLQHEKVEGAHAPIPVDYTHKSYVEKILNDMVGGFPSTFLQTSEMESRIEQSLIGEVSKKIEPKVLDALGWSLTKKYFWSVMGLLAVVLVTGSLSGLSTYLNSEADIENILNERLEELELISD